MFFWVLLFFFSSVLSHVNKCPKDDYFFDNIKDVCFSFTSQKTVYENFNVVQVDTHDKILKHWLKNYGILKEEKYTLLHIDSHADLSLPLKANRKNLLSWKWNKIKNKYGVSIASFIIPLVYLGLIDKIIWIHNYEQYYDPFHSKTGKTSFSIGNLKNSNKIFVNSTSDYFADPDRMVKQKQYENIQHVEVYSINLEKGRKIDLNLKNSKILLDIDFDYFSTNNPGLSDIALYFKSYEIAENVVNVMNGKSYSTKKFRNLPTKLREQLKKMKTTERHKLYIIIHQFLMKCFGIEEKKKFLKCSRISRILAKKKNIEKLQLKMNDFIIQKIYEELDEDMFEIIGRHWSTPHMPKFILKENEIRKKFGVLEQFFRNTSIKKENLKFISLAKSQECGHTPRFLIKFIEMEIFQFLEKLNEY
eukprot:gene2974-4984_t